MKQIHGFYQLALCATILVLGGCSLSDTALIHNRVSIDGVDVSAKTVGEARKLLSETGSARMADTVLKLDLPGGPVVLSAGSFGIVPDTETALREAAALERNGGERVISSGFTVEEEALRAACARFAAEYSSTPRDASVIIDKDAAIPLIYSEEAIGVDIDGDALYQAVKSAALKGEFTVDVPHAALAPAVTLSSIQERQGMVSQFSTTFEDRPHNDPDRVHNISKAAALINGTVLAPGEEFDCNAVLGDRTGENGWLKAPGIRDGRYEDEYGGGVCQVSSTLFNAVLAADLEVTERTPHSWPMGYVEIGRDATISTGGKNFRFVNSSDTPLYIFMHVDEALETLTASLYGRPLEDGRYIVVSSEKTGTLESAGEQILLDETLPYNTADVRREARDGKTAVTYKNYYSREGELLERVVAYEDTYRAIDGLTYVSTDLYYAQ